MFDTKVASTHKILDFDIENRPLSYWFGDVTTSEITAIAWGWAHQGHIAVRTLQPPPRHESSMIEMLEEFRVAYDAADIVTGHFIRKHDLPIINAHMIEFGLPPLGSKLTQDTKLDLVKRGGLAVSQQALAAMLEVKAPKPPMSVQRWRDANRLTPQGIESAVVRVVGDVKQHKEMRLALVEAGLLKPPMFWRP